MPVQNTSYHKVVQYLRQLDLSTDEIEAYLGLLRSGPQTVLSLSRTLKTGRTKLYPLLEDLAVKQLVIVQERHYGTSYRAAGPETLNFLVSKREQVTQNLRSGLPEVLHSLEELQQTSPESSRITEYHGLDGIKQMYWNISQAQGSYYILELTGIKKQLGSHLAEKLNTALSKKQVSGFILTNSKPAAPARRLNPNVFRIEAETYTYNNTVGLINLENDKLQGVEIQNKQLADQYRQFLSFLWVQSGS